MGKIKTPGQVKVFCGLLYSDEEIVSAVKNSLKEIWGKVDMEAGPFPFDFTDYYAEEMGQGLKKRFFSFQDLQDPDYAWEWKITTNRLEEQSASLTGGKRIINLDPGYLNLSKVVLLSTKDYYHRIYLGAGVYAETTLHFNRGAFAFFPWTYPDYQTESYLDFFTSLRNIYQEQIKDKR